MERLQKLTGCTEVAGKRLRCCRESNEELYSALARGKLDGVIDDSPIALHFSRATPGLRYAYHFERTECEYAVMTRLGNTALRDRINVTLAQMEFDGTLPCLRRIWFGSENLSIA
jgi:ABC-type amino acid transport substrate-binding protein